MVFVFIFKSIIRFRHKVLELSSGIDEIGEFRWTICIYSLVYRILVIVVVIKSVKSIGKVSALTVVYGINCDDIAYLGTKIFYDRHDNCVNQHDVKITMDVFDVPKFNVSLIFSFDYS